MRVRLSIILLLVLATMMIASGQQPTVKDDSTAGQQESGLTPFEEREALDLAARFDERLRATSDFGKIVDEMFVQDFSQRLKLAPQDSLPMVFLDKSLEGRASPEELRRYYVASMNFYELCFRLYKVTSQLKKQSGSEDDPKFQEMMPPEVIDVLLKNPMAAEWVKEELSDEDEKENNDTSQPATSTDSPSAVQTETEAVSGGAQEETSDIIIKTISQLNDASATFEEANQMLRERLKFMPMTAQTVSADGKEESADVSCKPDLKTLDEGEFGLAHGTQVIRLNLSLYCLYLIKTEGQLKILSAHMYVD